MSKFTVIKRDMWPQVEVFDGDTFLAVGISGIGGGFQIHLTAAQAAELADVLRMVSSKQLAKDEVSA